MRSRLLAVVAVAFGGLTSMADRAPASHNTDLHSDNMSLVSNFNLAGEYGLGSDLAFWGNTVVAGIYDGPGGFRLIDVSNPAAPVQRGLFDCPGTQADVSIYKQLVFVSVDAPRAPGEEGVEAHDCGAPAANASHVAAGQEWEGVRIVSIANPAKPEQIAAVKTDCGSHTHTLIPDEAKNRLLLYVLSYPLNPQGPSCNAETHRKISVIEVPLSAPETAKVIGTPSVEPAIGCHDSTVFVARKLAGAACLTESQLWDVSDPANPKVVSHITNPRINIHHSVAFSWDGEKMALGDELGGAAAAPGCIGPEEANLGGLWFYDVKDPASPQQVGAYRLPQNLASVLCTAHLFNPVPLRSEKDVLVASWYTGATTVIDWTDPANAEQIGFYIPRESGPGAAWSSYWYNGRIYANNYHETGQGERGLDVLGITHPILADAITLDRLNPQLQEPLPAPPQTPGAGQVIKPPPSSTPRASCVRRRRLTIRLRSPRGDRLVSAVVFVNGRRVKSVKGRRLRRGIALRGLPRGRFRVDITVRTRKGKRISSTRHYRTCATKRKRRG